MSDILVVMLYLCDGMHVLNVSFLLVEGHNPVVKHQVCQATRIPMPTSLRLEVRVDSQPSIAPLVVVIEMQQKHIQEKCIIAR